MSRGERLDFAAENQVGYGFHREVIIKEKAQKTLHRYDLQVNEIVYQEVWSEDFPHGVNTGSVIAVYIVSGGYKLLLQDKSKSTTLVLSSDGREILNSWHHEGILLTILFDDEKVYVVENTYGEYEVVIVNKDRSETRLQPVAVKSPWTHPYLSVCQYCGFSSRIAVTSKDHTLDIYYRNGR